MYLCTCLEGRVLEKHSDYCLCGCGWVQFVGLKLGRYISHHTQPPPLSFQHAHTQALAEQTSSLFQSYEFEGVNSLLTNILGAPSTSHANTYGQTSPLEVSPDRYLRAHMHVPADVHQ